MTSWDTGFAHLPLVAILRGLTPEEAPAIVGTLVEEGFRLIEVPLNSPHPFDSIEKAARQFEDEAIIGAGTVLTAEDARRTHEAGGRLIVAPNLNPEVAEATRSLDMTYCPGVMTVTELFQAHALGAQAIKLFPAEIIQPVGVKAMRSVVPKEIALLPVGGVSPDKVAPYVEAGASGFGLGSALYKAGRGVAEVREAAQAFVAAAKTSGLG